MKKLALILGLLAISSPAFSATWIEYNAKTSDATYYYDQDGVKIKKLGNGTKYIEVWEKISYSIPQLQNYRPVNCSQYITTNCNQYYQEVKRKSVYDCWNDKIYSLSRVEYAGNGNVIDSGNWVSEVSFGSSNSWNEVVPDTIGEGLLKQICSAYRHQLK